MSDGQRIVAAMAAAAAVFAAVFAVGFAITRGSAWMLAFMPLCIAWPAQIGFIILRPITGSSFKSDE